jgi:uncharacterized protein with HEPN domain
MSKTYRNDKLYIEDIIDYRTIKDFRNVLAHEYFGVDMEIVWMIATDKIPELKQNIQRIEI